ncbi:MULTISPECIES: hypothetical protein [unclassified Streptomyces]|uniref:hypothetical protein n=1 Tax=unclassified Streptomyces TaxID=2593676 RepID=UPI001CB6EDCE|nr:MULTISPECIES: hypothetical protein [unclassified Streptomyces]MBD0708133.1 hypothetical protein [Streptomyces sp. CBMA291]MBD0715782.1 hypothetical protein [Streptomyces sp. CBMA370]
MDGDFVVAVDGRRAFRFRTRSDLASGPSWEWTEAMDTWGEGITAPVVEGATVWLPESDDSVVRVVHKTTHARLFTVRMEREGPYRLVSAAHRVFVARGGRIAAMPVYGV